MQLFYPLHSTSGNVGVHRYHQQDYNKSYIPITGCVLSHILSSKELSSLEKIYYILADSLACINFNKGRNRSISLPAKSWAERLSCSKSEVFMLQKSLEDKGYFIIYRDKNDQGQNKRNTITTTIPDKVFNNLKYEPDRFNLGDIDNTKIHHSKDRIYLPTLEDKRQHLEKTKMFIRVPYEFLKQLNSSCSISATSKVIMIFLFIKIYKSAANKYDPDDVLSHHLYSFITSYQELQKELKLHRNSLSKALRDLEDNNLISKKRFFAKDTEECNSRASKSLWQISLLGVTAINNYDPKDQQQAVISNQTKVEYNNNKALESFKERRCTKYDPPCTDSGQLYIKDFILKNSIDYIDANSLNLSVNNLSDNLQSKENVKKEFFGNEQSLFPSKSYNNSFFLDDSFRNYKAKPIDYDTTQYDFLDRTNLTSKQEYLETPSNKQSCFSSSSESATKAIKDISEKEISIDFEQHEPQNNTKELRHFYPLSSNDVDMLNFKANREFNTNFVNQLLLKLYIKYPEKRFKNKFTFLSYMEKILKNEKHQGPLVNHTTFRFSCNINTEEKNLLECERFLSQIENSFDTSKEMQVKKKTAGRFSSKTAYEILTQVEFKTNYDNSFITALIPSNLALSERQIEILGEQLEAVYGMNGYYVQEVVNEMKESTEVAKKEEQEKNKNLAKEKNNDTREQSNVSKISTFAKIPDGKLLSMIHTNTSWHSIRKGLIEELGEAIYTAWFSKAVANESKETSTITLMMPTRFMADWVRNNYSHVIQRLAVEYRIKRVEYGYKY